MISMLYYYVELFHLLIATIKKVCHHNSAVC